MSRSNWSLARRASGSARSLSHLVERVALALRAEDYPTVARETEHLLMTAGQVGHGAVLRQAALLLSAAERRDAAGSVEALVRLAHDLDTTRRAA